MDRIWQRIGRYMPVPPPSPDEMRFHDPAQLIAILDGAGFVDVEVEVSPFEVALPDAYAWLAWLRSMEFVDYLAQMSPAMLEEFRGAAEIRFTMDALLTRARKPL
jgi:hypothetical protein